MRKFSFIVVDDEGNNESQNSTGFKRILMALEYHSYFQGVVEVCVDEKNTKLFRRNSDENSPIGFLALTSTYGEKNTLTFCDALEIFKREIANHDFFIFDLNLEKLKFNPCHTSNTCEEALKYENREPAKVLETGKFSRFIAGLEFYHLTDKDNRPKIFFSAATQTGELRKNVKFFYKRLEDTFVIDAEHNRYTDIKDKQTNEAFRAIDLRFQSRQIAILNRQSYALIEELDRCIANWSARHVPNADDYIIPDDGNYDTPKENYWSLRTLFPKQVNQIQVGRKTEENILHIKNVIHNYSFPKLYYWLIFLHAHGEDVKSPNLSENEITNRLVVLRNIDFHLSGSKSANYKKFSEIDLLKTFDGGDIGSIVHELRKIISMTFNTFDIKIIEIAEKTVEYDELINDTVKLLGEYGIYPGDIQWLYNIAVQNLKHCSGTAVTTHVMTEGEMLILTYTFENASIDTYDFHMLQNRIESYFESDRYKGDFVLSDEGLGDILEIVSKRYKADGHIQVGQKSITLASAPIIVDEKYSNFNYTFSFKRM